MLALVFVMDLLVLATGVWAGALPLPPPLGTASTTSVSPTPVCSTHVFRPSVLGNGMPAEDRADSLTTVLCHPAQTPHPKMQLPRDSPHDCTSTHLVLPADFTRGPVRTVWTQTATTTRHMDCAGCQFMELWSLDGGLGPVVHFTTTVTATGASTVTAFVCLKTASVV